MPTPDALVIGAGVAGLAAAAALGEAGLRVLVLEARDRVGGRIHTLREPDFPLPIELGAEFVHGRPDETISLIERGGLATYDVSERHDHHEHHDQMRRVLDRLDADGPDISFAEFLLHQADGPELAEGRRLAARYVEGFHAADLAQVSARAVAEAERGSASGASEAARILNGYAALAGELHRLAAGAGAEVRLGQRVTAVRWRRGAVTAEVHDSAGHRARFMAARAVLTFPLPLLQQAATASGDIIIDPFPAGWPGALAGLRTGHVVRTALRFRTRFWERGTSFVHHPDSPRWQLWWTPAPIDAPLLTGWCGGPPAERLARLEPGQLLQHAIADLAELFGTPAARIRELLVTGHTHDWSADPYARGAYSYVAAGGSGAPDRLAAPVESTIVVAGEAVAPPGRHGTVDGAIASGRRAAARLLGMA